MLASFLLLSPFAFPSTQTRQFYVSIQPPVGELMAPVFMSENEFKKEQGECSMWWIVQICGRSVRPLDKEGPVASAFLKSLHQD